MRFPVGMLMVSALGCATATPPEARFATRDHFTGSTSLVFTNATPAKICGLYMTADGTHRFGDNWLASGGLPSGASADFRVRPGRYQATWVTCRGDQRSSFFAATLTRDTAIEVREDTQLLAFVADIVAPTSRASLRDFHALVKFAGQPVDPARPAARQPAPQPVVARTEPRPAKSAKVELAEFIDRGASRGASPTARVAKRTATRGGARSPKPAS